MARSILDQAMPTNFNPMGDLGHIRDLDRTFSRDPQWPSFPVSN